MEWTLAPKSVLISLNLGDVKSTLTIEYQMTKRFARNGASSVINWRLRNVPDDYATIRWSMTKADHMRKPTLPKMVLSRLKKWLLEHGHRRNLSDQDK